MRRRASATARQLKGNLRKNVFSLESAVRDVGTVTLTTRLAVATETQ